MHFGRTDTLAGLDLRLPPDPPRTTGFLGLPHAAAAPAVRVGCPIWADRGWVGDLYPRGTPPKAYLRAYATCFDTVEVNSTFYQLLDADRIAHWREQTPPDFRFCPKVYRGITEHLHADDLAERIGFFSRVSPRSAIGWAFASPSFPTRSGPGSWACSNTSSSCGRASSGWRSSSGTRNGTTITRYATTW